MVSNTENNIDITSDFDLGTKRFVYRFRNLNDAIEFKLWVG